MKLYYSKTSPYSRKVRLVIEFKKIMNEVELIEINPFKDTLALSCINPLAKVPTLVMDNGDYLFDSPVICRYLDELSTGIKLVPTEHVQHWNVMRWQALADGVLDAAYNIVMENRRDAMQQSSSCIASWMGNVNLALAKMEEDISDLGNNITLAHLAVASALGYLNFRLPLFLQESNKNQFSSYPLLKSWFDNFDKHPAMELTNPHKQI